MKRVGVQIVCVSWVEEGWELGTVRARCCGRAAFQVFVWAWVK